jgi:hypothetical protein
MATPSRKIDRLETSIFNDRPSDLAAKNFILRSLAKHIAECETKLNRRQKQGNQSNSRRLAPPMALALNDRRFAEVQRPIRAERRLR